jgi:pyridinium-3,5-bisthiocarboxylic acid mononucleotide nickel chelatase
VTAAWFHCFAGIAGDMALGSLLDAGADLVEVHQLLDRLPVRGWSIEVDHVLRAGLGATHVDVVANEDGVVRTFSHIAGLIEEARLPDRVRDRALATFTALAEVEGRLHGRPAAQVHFHEVGGLDAIVDIVGTCSALEVLDIDDVYASAVATGTGVVRTLHGVYPNPSPAVVELLRGAPTYGRDVAVELTTPTGAALLAALAKEFGPLPLMTIGSTGFGAGTAELDGMPNVTQVVLGEVVAGAVDTRQPLVLVEANLDDATGETLAHTLGALLDAGAQDAWIAPIVMKKGRPAHTVSALCDTATADAVAATLARETGTLGVRRVEVDRWAASRRIDEVDVDDQPVRVKVSPGRVKAEHDDAVRASRRTGVPLREVVRRAEQAWHLAHPPDDGDDGEAG